MRGSSVITDILMIVNRSHDDLQNLDADDHTHYLNVARHDLAARHPLANLDILVCSEAEAAALILTHKNLASAHHAKYTDAEAIAAIALDTKLFVPATTKEDTDAGITRVTLDNLNAVLIADDTDLEFTLSFRVPYGKTGISSIKVIYYNQTINSDLYLQFLTSKARAASATIHDSSVALAIYGTPANANYREAIDVPAECWDGLGALLADDLIGIKIRRKGDDASDTFNVAWPVYGILITFT